MHGMSDSDLLSRLYGCTNDMSRICELYSGSKGTMPLPSISALPFPPTSPQTRPDNVGQNPIDVMLIEDITFHNFFGGQSVGIASLSGSGHLPSTAALHILPSFFNHSCIPNATWRTMGDLLVVRANKDIQRGVEITLAYTSPIGGYSDRAQRLYPKITTPCDCQLCTWDRKDGEGAAALRKRMAAKDLRRSSTEAQLQADIRSMSSTYPSPGRSLHPSLVESHDEAMQWYQDRYGPSAASIRGGNNHQARMSVYHGIEAIKAAGMVVLDEEKHRAYLDAQNKPVYGSRRQRELSPPSEFTLPIAKNHLPANLAIQDQCMLIMTQIYRMLSGCLELTESNRWIRAAWYGERSIFPCLRLDSARTEATPWLFNSSIVHQSTNAPLVAGKPFLTYDTRGYLNWVSDMMGLSTNKIEIPVSLIFLWPMGATPGFLVAFGRLAWEEPD